MGASEKMGPAAFWWPPDRVWSEEMDNTPPCGSVASVTNRTAFPLSGCQPGCCPYSSLYLADDG